jgi:hypothetical protein
MKVKLLLLAVMSFSAAHATMAIDQSALVSTDGMAGFHQANLFQSFQQIANNIAGAEVLLLDGYGSGTGDITISLWNALPNAGGNLITSGTALGVAGGQWATVFWTPVAIAADTTYYLQFSGTNPTLALTGDANNGYSRGQIFANAGFASFANYDFTFQTYEDTTSNVGSLVGTPEPATMTMMAAGLAGLVMARRRR